MKNMFLNSNCKNSPTPIAYNSVFYLPLYTASVSYKETDDFI